MASPISATPVRNFRPAEARASATRIRNVLSLPLLRTPSDFTLTLIPSETTPEHGFKILSRARNWLRVEINPNTLNRNQLIETFSQHFDVEEQELQHLRDQLWLDEKLERAVRNVPWIQKTDISVEDLYGHQTRLVVGLGDVCGSASYEGFWRNAYANSELTEVQTVFRKARIRLFPIPVQMETETDRANMAIILPAILRDPRIVRIALTKPVKVDAVDTGLFTIWDPGTLPTGAVNTAAIEEGSDGERYFVGRSTDGEGTVARIIEELHKLNRSLADSSVGLVGLGGFGRALLGKLLMNPRAPKNIYIVEADVAYDNAVQALEMIRQAHQTAGGEQNNNIQIDRLSSFEKKRGEHPLAGVDVLMDATAVGMNDNNISIPWLDFIKSGMIVGHAAYRTAAGETRITPILIEAHRRGAVVFNGLSDWIGHQWLQVVEDLKRATGLRPGRPGWNDQKWDILGAQVRNAAIHWADTRGFKDASAVLK